jgi:putative transcriptional regulator
MAFSEHIKKIRRKAFLTQEDFAKEIGVSCISVTRWETGKAKPNLKAMKLIDEYCKKNAIDFDISEEISND